MRLEAHIYNLETGLVRVTITGEESVIKANTKPGEAVYLGKIDPRTQKIENGVVKDQEIKPPPPKPEVPDISYNAFLKAIAANKEAEFKQLVKTVLETRSVRR